jgi:hypothetical protein
MTKEELEKATGQELIDERNYCGVDGYYGDYLDNVNAEMLKRFNRLAELEKENKVLTQNLEDSEIIITGLKAQIEKMKCCGNCVHFDFTEPNYCHKGVYRANQNVCGEWCFGN